MSDPGVVEGAARDVVKAWKESNKPIPLGPDGYPLTKEGWLDAGSSPYDPGPEFAAAMERLVDALDSEPLVEGAAAGALDVDRMSKRAQSWLESPLVEFGGAVPVRNLARDVLALVADREALLERLEAIRLVHLEWHGEDADEECGCALAAVLQGGAK